MRPGISGGPDAYAASFFGALDRFNGAELLHTSRNQFEREIEIAKQKQAEAGSGQDSFGPLIPPGAKLMARTRLDSIDKVRRSLDDTG